MTHQAHDDRRHQLANRRATVGDMLERLTGSYPDQGARVSWPGAFEYPSTRGTRCRAVAGGREHRICCPDEGARPPESMERRECVAYLDTTEYDARHVECHTGHDPFSG